MKELGIEIMKTIKDIVVELYKSLLYQKKS